MSRARPARDRRSGLRKGHETPMQARNGPEGSLSLCWGVPEVRKQPQGVPEMVAQVAKRPRALL
eukprot:295407-Lingulodinium_polyedra.AAC.1